VYKVWSHKPPVEPGWYQVAHVDSRGTWLVQVRLYDASKTTTGETPTNRSRLWVALPGDGAENNLARMPWIWGPRIPLVEVPEGEVK
jgi:hypothetical protein